MAKEVTFTKIEFHFQEAFRLHLKSCLKELEGAISISLTVSLGNCYGMVRDTIPQQKLLQVNKVSVSFQKQLSILFESQNCGAITVLFSSSQSRISTFHTSFPLHPQDKALALSISNESSRPVFSINSKLSQIDKGTIILKNITGSKIAKTNLTAKSYSSQARSKMQSGAYVHFDLSKINLNNDEKLVKQIKNA